MPFQIIRNDITKVKADAIVNTANPEPVYAGGTDAAIYLAAGARKLLAERKKIGRIEPGEAAVTPAFRLHARYIIHTAGPVWIDGSHGEFALLDSCYRKSLLLARQLGCRSIAFPLISTGVYGFPKDRALDIALGRISEFLRDTDPEEDEMEVTLVVFDRRAFELSRELVSGVEQFISEHDVRIRREKEYGGAILEEPQAYAGRRRQDAFRRNLPFAGSVPGVPESPYGDRRLSGSVPVPPQRREQAAADLCVQAPEKAADLCVQAPEKAADLCVQAPEESADLCSQAPEESAFQVAGDLPAESAQAPAGQRSGRGPAFTSTAAPPRRSLQDVMDHVGETFQQCLLRMIDERGLTDAQVYKRANLNRKLFSKIRCNPDYTPSRRTAISLAVALELNMDETTDFLRRGGIALSPGSRFDLIISYCVQNRIYDTMKINAILFDYDQPLLGA